MYVAKPLASTRGPTKRAASVEALVCYEVYKELMFQDFRTLGILDLRLWG